MTGSASTPAARVLLADIGGTNARFALADTSLETPLLVDSIGEYAVADFPSLADAAQHYLDQTGATAQNGVFAVAGRVDGDEARITNHPWVISLARTRNALGFDGLKLINDFAAQALAAPVLDADDLRTIGPVTRGAEGAPIVVLGAGTGFGTAMVVRTERGDIAIPSEGGHAAYAPYDGVEAAIWASLRRTHGRVSIERLLSGPGLYALYRGLADVRGVAADLKDEKEVMAAGQTGGDLLADEALDRFCEILGSVAGDIALTCGARGGVYVSGGMAPRMADRLASGGFRRRFEDKGRLSDYTREIPTHLVVHPFAALVGAARVLEQMEGSVL